MKSMMVIRDPEAFQVLADENRRKIIYLLRVKEMTVSQISSELGITVQTVYHHIKKLIKRKMVEVVREERLGHLIESYYRATAEDFLIACGRAGSETLRDKNLSQGQMTAILKALKRIGFDLKPDKAKIEQIVDLNTKLEEGPSKIGEIKAEIWGMEDIDDLTKVLTEQFATALAVSDDEFAEREKNRRAFRDLLRSLLSKQEAPATST